VRLRAWRLALAVIASVLIWSPLHAAPVFIDFEGLTEFTSVDDLVSPEVIFSNAMVLTAGTSINELEFPPQSGLNVIYDSGSPMRLDFSTPISSFSAYFTYVVPVTVQFFDASSALLGVVSSQFNENFVSSGNLSNELLSATFAGTTSVTITGGAFGGSFVLDDLSFETTDGTPEPNPVPEPGTMVLIGSGLAALMYGKRRRRTTLAS